jgi:hypothetical protein
MIRPGRKSASYLAAPPVEGELPRLQAPAHLNDDERAIFDEIVEDRRNILPDRICR